MARSALAGIGLLVLLTACGEALDSAGSLAEQPSATIMHGSADAAAEQRAIEALQARYRFDGPPKTILFRPLTSRELSEVWCYHDCDSYHVLILEGAFVSMLFPTEAPTFVPRSTYRYIIAIVDPSSGVATDTFAVSDPREVRWRFPDADIADE